MMGGMAAGETTGVRPAVRALTAVFGLAMLAGAAVFGGGGLEALLRVNRAADWPRANGRILESRVGQVFVSGRSGGWRPICEVKYAFVVDGRTYTGDRLDAAGDLGWSATAREDQARYPPGKAAAVRYNPADPTDCCLEARTNWTVPTLLTVGGVLGAGGAALLIFAAAARGVRRLDAAGRPEPRS
jgi:hypothetical protein